MPQVITCSACGKSFRVPDEMLGKRLRCPHCESPTQTVDDDAQLPSSVTSAQEPGDQESPETETDAADSLQVSATAPSSRPTSVLAGRRKAKMPLWALVTGGVVIAALVGVTIFMIGRSKKGQPKPEATSTVLKLVAVPKVNCKERAELSLQLRVRDVQSWTGKIRFRLVKGPAGLTVSETGKVQWSPAEQHGGGQHSVSVEVAAREGGDKDQQTFVIEVAETNSRPVVEPIKGLTAKVGEPLQLQVKASDPDTPAAKLVYSFGSAVPNGVTIDPATGEIAWTPAPEHENKIVRFVVRVREEGADGLSTDTAVGIRVGGSSRPSVVVKEPNNTQRPKNPLGLTKPKQPTVPKPETTPATPQDNWSYAEEVAKLYSDKKLLRRNDYERLRRVEAKRVWRQYEARIKAGMGSDFAKFVLWLEENPVFREELLIALSEDDDVVSVMKVLDELRKKFPKEVRSYGNLAIATAIVWDKPKAVYDYGRHQRRAKASMPSGMANAFDNFQYITGTERFMQGRGQWLPWEFLAHVVNHKTPADERQWALQNYVSKRVMFGRCYKDVPYDMLMLNTQSQEARLNDKVYNFLNLRGFGGVCAHQADFASRVGKSIGVPAAYVRGPSRSGSYHAWVMWVELKSVTQRSIGFTLESFGRYRLDRYYVGTLLEPQSGKRITDRQLELRLQTVGLDPQAKRHADLLMRAYPFLRDRFQWGTSDRFRFISQVIKSCPGNEAAWIELSKMAGEEVVRDKHRKQMLGILDQLFITFAAFPDFTWTVFDDLVQFEPRRKERQKMYERLLGLYHKQKRPDLVCEAGLKLAEHLVVDNQELKAIQGLSGLIDQYADEGRYVPRMLDRLEQVCAEFEGAQPHLLAFYRKFLPKIPRRRGNRPSPYCIKMHERGIQKFQQAQQMQVAQLLQVELAKIRQGR